jgi:hypothetical protein
MPTALICLVLALVPASAAQRISIRSVYVSSHLVWTPPPRDPELPKYETSRGEVAVFYPSGEFGGGSFLLGRYRKSGAMFIVPAEGFVVWRGSWNRNSDGSITVTRQVVNSGMVLNLSKQRLPGPMKEERWVPRGVSKGRLAAILKSPSGDFEPVQSMSDLDTIDRLINLPPPAVR